MEKLRLEEVLRYVFSGGLFWLTLALVYIPKEKMQFDGLSGGVTALVLGVVLLTGSLLYTFHRAFTYPFIFLRLSLLILSAFKVARFEWKMLIPFAESKAELDIDKFRLAIKYEHEKIGDYLDSVIAEWSAQVHFLYCSALAVGLALSGGIFFPPLHLSAWKLLIVCAITLLLAAIVHHLRLLIRIKTLADSRPTPNTRYLCMSLFG